MSSQARSFTENQALPQILLIDDSEEVFLAVTDALGANYAIEHVTDCKAASEILSDKKYDLILVDVVLPDQNGLEFCRTIRALEGHVNTPLIVLSGLTDVQGKVTGFDNGADDYVVKPFVADELRARVTRMLRRMSRAETTSIELGNLRLDPTMRRAFIEKNGKQTHADFTPSEFRMLLYLVRKNGEIATRDEIMRAVWTSQVHVGRDNIYTHMHAIRRKLADSGVVIESISGGGYKLVVSDVKA